MNIQNETAQKILECACEKFAEKGYHKANICDICGCANANRAAVNYYFRSKQSLYKEVFNHAWDCFCQTYPLDPKDAKPEEKLYIFISSLIQGIFDPGPGGWFMSLMFHEAVSPSESVIDIVMCHINQFRQKLDDIIVEITGETDSDKLQFMNMSVMGQCLFFNMTRNIRKLKMERKIPPFDRPEFHSSDKIKQIIDHSYNFCLNGLLINRKPGE